MKTIKVSSLPLKDVITDIAKALRVSYTENCSFFELQLPASFGTGTIKGIDFEDGLGLIEYDCTFFKEVIINFSVNDIHPLKFLFCLEGEFEHKFENESQWHSIIQYKNAIVGSLKNNGHVLKFKKNVPTVLHSLELSRAAFKGKMDCELNSLSIPMINLLTDDKANNVFYYDGFYSLKLANLFREIHTFQHNYYIQKLFLEGTAFRILTLQIMQFEDDLNSKGTILRRVELKQLDKAIKIINERISDLPGINDIGLEVGLNSKKLQRGFQELVGTSVNSYIQLRRLEMAQTLLNNTDKTLAEISDIVGYKSKSYFSKVFKVAYGINPSAFRKMKS